MQFYIRLDSFYEVATFNKVTLLATFGEIGGLVSFLHTPLALIIGYIAGVSFEAKIISKLFFIERDSANDKVNKLDYDQIAEKINTSRIE